MRGEFITAVFWYAKPCRMLEETCQVLGPTC